jgi:hypothetical protein
MASSYIIDKEIAIIRERQKNGENVYFYPLLLTPTPNAGLEKVRDKNLRPRDAKPFSSFSYHDRLQHMTDAANEIATIAQQIVKRKGARQPSAPSSRPSYVHHRLARNSIRTPGWPGSRVEAPRRSLDRSQSEYPLARRFQPAWVQRVDLPAGRVLDMAPAKVLQGAVRLQGLTSSPTPDTPVLVARAFAGTAIEGARTSLDLSTAVDG